MMLEARRAGTAGADMQEMLELCAAYPPSVVEELLVMLQKGGTEEELVALGSRLSASKGTGVLRAYHALLECAGGVQGAMISALREPSSLSSSSWQDKFLRRRNDERRMGWTEMMCETVVRSNGSPNTAVGQNLEPSACSAAPAPRPQHLPSKRESLTPVHKEGKSPNPYKTPTSKVRPEDGHKSSPEIVSALPTVKASAAYARTADTSESKGDDPNGTRVSTIAPKPGQAAKISALSSFLNSPEMQETKQKPLTPGPAEEVCQEAMGDANGEQVETNGNEQQVGSPKSVGEKGSTERSLDWDGLFNLIANTKGTISRDQFLGFLKEKGREILGIDDDDDEMVDALFKDMTNEAFDSSHEISRSEFFKVFEVTEDQETCKYSKSPQAKKKRKSREFPRQGYICQHCGKEGGQKDSHWHQNCPVFLQSQNPEHLRRFKGKVVSKIEKSPKGEGKELAFIRMESSPGVVDVYVPKSIFIGHDLEDWKRIQQGTVIEVMAYNMVRGSNRWRAATFLSLTAAASSERAKSSSSAARGESASRWSVESRNQASQGMRSNLKPVNVRAALVPSKRKKSSRGNDDDLIESRVINDRTGRNEIAKIKEAQATQDKRHKSGDKDSSRSSAGPARPQAPAEDVMHKSERTRPGGHSMEADQGNHDDTDSEDQPALSIDSEEEETEKVEVQGRQNSNLSQASIPRKIGENSKQVPKDRHPSVRSANRKKIDTDCTFWLKGCCNKGDSCPFSHQAEPPMIVCKFLLRGDCSRGEECSFSHDLSRVPCKFFHVGGNCVKGAACPFGHGTLTDEQVGERWRRSERLEATREEGREAVEGLVTCQQREWVEREWQVNSKEMKELLAKALRTEQEAKARVVAGEEVHIEDVSGRGPSMIWGEDDVWLGIPITPGTAGLQQEEK